VHTQPEVGEAGYDAGAKILYDFFRRELPQYLEEDLDPLGRHIIRACLEHGSLADYESLLPQEIFVEDTVVSRRRF
jgi:hypothetical protein